MSSFEKFSGKAEIYEQYRPSYPDEFYEYLAGICTPLATNRIADIGAGTGIFSRGLLERGWTVDGVEPNADMRAVCSGSLASYPEFTLYEGTAEHTGLETGHYDMVTAAQAFHWFDPDLFAAECRRILRPEGHAVLVWNSRDSSNEVVAGNADIFREFCPGFTGFSGSTGRPAFTGMDDVSESLSAVSRFFRDGVFEYRIFPRSEEYDLDGFIGRCLSASYAPVEGEENYYPLIAALTGLFEKYCENGHLRVPGLTRSYMGKV